MKKVFTVLILLTATSLLFAQKKDIKFGEFAKKELEMDYYNQDSSAAAVILFDIGYFNANEFEFTRHLRVKVLKQSGSSYANWTLRTPSKNEINAIVANLENGEIVEEKLDKSTIEEQELISGVRLNKVFLPNVKKGTVFDIKYRFNGLPYEWKFQELVPVKYSELLVEQSGFIDYTTRFYGFEDVTVVNDHHWIARDVRAFKKEPFLNHYTNYLTKLEFEISTISVPRLQFYKEYNTSWEKVSENLIKSDYFGAIIRTSGFLRSKAKEIKDMDVSKKEKIFEAYKYIQENFKYNGEDDVFASRYYNSNWKKYHTGSSADINLALLSLLDKADIQAYPVVLSTRKNGLLVPFSASMDQLNYVLAMVLIDGEQLILDAAGENLVPGIVPEKCLNGKGWLVDKGYGIWVDLLAGNKYVNQKYVQIGLNDLNEWEANVSEKHSKYDYLKWLKTHKKYDDNSKYAAYLEQKYSDLFIENYELSNNDDAALLSTEKYSLLMDDVVADLGNEIIVDPFVLTDFKENPFKSDERRYPVDLAYPISQSSIFVVKIPDGYTLKSMPESQKVDGGEGNFNFLFLSNYSEATGQLQIQFKMNIERAIFTEDEYQYLRDFYSVISDKMNDPIMLVKN